MAKVTINNTDYAGFLSIYLNDYYPITVDEKAHHTPISRGVVGVCLRHINEDDCLELHISHEEHPFFLSNVEGDSVLQVDLINGIAPVSMQDLINKLMALLV